MQIEVITHKPSGAAHPTPLLFVHGAYGGAWTWEPDFLSYFADRGYVASALSLRGHGESEGSERLMFARLRDFVADVSQVIREMPTTPVLIGHSMGGMVVQKYMCANPIPAGVLMASVPPHGMIGTFFGMAFTNPELFREMWQLQSLGPWVVNGGSVRRALFSRDTPQSVVNEVSKRLQHESLLVILDLMGLDLPPSTFTQDVPVLVLGAENDAFVFPSAVTETARTYNTTAEFFPNMAHAMMLEPGWEKVAERIANWLDATLVETQPRAVRRAAC